MLTPLIITLSAVVCQVCDTAKGHHCVGGLLTPLPGFWHSCPNSEGEHAFTRLVITEICVHATLVGRLNPRCLALSISCRYAAVSKSKGVRRRRLVFLGSQPHRCVLRLPRVHSAAAGSPVCASLLLASLKSSSCSHPGHAADLLQRQLQRSAGKFYVDVVDSLVELCQSDRVGRGDLFDLDAYIPAQCEEGVRSPRDGCVTASKSMYCPPRASPLQRSRLISTMAPFFRIAVHGSPLRCMPERLRAHQIVRMCV